MAVMNRHVCPVENWYGALCRQLHSKAPFISVPSGAGAAASQTETLSLTALLWHWRACPSPGMALCPLTCFPPSLRPFGFCLRQALGSGLSCSLMREVW